MTNPDLARELEELLPCSGDIHGDTCHGSYQCENCSYRPAILTWAERKLDEQRRDIEWTLAQCAMRESEQ